MGLSDDRGQHVTKFLQNVARVLRFVLAGVAVATVLAVTGARPRNGGHVAPALPPRSRALRRSFAHEQEAAAAAAAAVAANSARLVAAPVAENDGKRTASFEQPLPLVERGSYQEDDPHLCVVVATMKHHGAGLTALLATLASSHYPQLSFILADTDPEDGSAEWLAHHAQLFNGGSHADVDGASGARGRRRVHVSPVTQSTVLKEFPQLAVDFGYTLTDRVVEELLKEPPLPELPEEKCDYFMATTGNGIYGGRLVPALLPYMRAKYDVIGFDFTTHYMIDDTRVDRPGFTDQTLRAEFRPHWIDRGAGVFRAESLKEHPVTFVLHALREHGKLTPLTLGYMTELADGMFFSKLAARPGAKSAIVRRTLYMSQ